MIFARRKIHRSGGGRSLHDMAILNAIRENSNAYDHADGNAPAAVNPAALKLGREPGNPGFVAQADVQVFTRFFTVSAGGAYTLTTAAAVYTAQPTLEQQFFAFFFGLMDFKGGFARLRNQFPARAPWSYDSPQIFGDGQSATIFGTFDAVARGQFQPGDLLIPFTATVATVNYVCVVVIRSQQVAYATMLNSLTSDMFTINMIRYIVPDTSTISLDQYQNNLTIVKQSLFGKFDSDSVSPNSFKLPEQQQQQIIDIPLKKGIDKQVAIVSPYNPRLQSFQFSLFMNVVEKTAW